MPRPDGLHLSNLAQNDAGDGLPLCIDAHCHIFNGQDIDIAGFLRGPVASDADPALQKFIRALAPVAADVVYAIAPSGKAEAEALANERRLEGGLEAPGAAGRAMRRRDRAQTEVIATPRAERSQETDHKQQYRQVRPEGSGLESPSLLTPAPNFSVEEVRSLLGRPAGGGLESPFSGGDGTFRLIKRLSSRRSDNAYWLAETFSASEPRVGVFMPVLDDFDRWLGCPNTRTTARDQVLVTERIAVASRGAILPLVGYNPWTDIEEDDASFLLVQEAIINRGFVGVKIYPPMGYLPYGNAALEPQENWPNLSSLRGFGAQLDANNLRLFNWCRDNDVPVMAHSSRSQGATADSAILAGPPGWRDALAACPGLKVCLAHFGGDNSFASKSNFEWARQFTELMQRPEGANLYADFSYFTGILDGDADIQKQVRQALTSSVADRFMYGSDWHLLIREQGVGAYATDLAALVRGIGDEAQANRLLRSLFFESALSLYGLRAGGATRNRLEAFYRRHGVENVAWMEIIDAAA
ncbi:hypothetical protein DF3PB_140024 [uncultured Defluviicoccus sp.]|uniref:Amidohydrolase-related domain-containing protein n=1 Tax=metagenome TaxID=256318 RepID=A0A380TB67_9ZZZZ|nr:hypothetical protein DF3PB_140024 [uncultured Defluviicoccus sp.]